jgi:ribonucleoside-diphosphate reductase alpha chain
VTPNSNFPSVFTEELFARQYALYPGETFQQGMRRVTDVIFPPSQYPAENEALYNLLITGRGQFGGRVLAGADSEHGNMLNCFVQDGAPYLPGSTRWVLELARRLALVTKVGGGNGLNLDPIQAAPVRPDPDLHMGIGKVYLAIDQRHPDAANVLAGRFLDQVTGKYVTPGYRAIEKVQLYTFDSVSEPYTEMNYFHGIAGGDEASSQVIHVGDSIEDIWESAADMVHLMLEGFDVVLVLSALRAEGTPVNGSGGNSSGAASFAVEVFDNFARWAKLGGAENAGPVATLRYVFAPTLRVIRQGGSRRGAGMATLSVRHEDLLDFITAKDLDREANEGDISTFNISVLADERFMEAALDTDGPEADDLQLIANHAWATGEPGLLFVDTINRHNPLAKIDGDIVATNPCGEIGLYPGEPCDLGALNMAAYWDENDEDFDWSLLHEDTKLMVHALDRVLTVEKAPLPEIAEAIKDKRRIGLGIMGLADALVRASADYDSNNGRYLAQTLIDSMRFAAVEASEELGQRYGVPTGVQRAVAAAPHGGNFTPRRNIALLTVAPTGTISMMTGVSSGIEPIYSAITFRRIGTEYHEIVHPLLVDILEEHPASGRYSNNNEVWNWEYIRKELSEHHGSLKPLLRSLPVDDRLSAFVTAHELNPMAHVAMQSTVQNAFDYQEDLELSFAGNSISKTINLPNSAPVHVVLDVYSEAYNSGCKGVTVYRDGSRALQVLSTSAPEEATSEEDAPPAPPTVVDETMADAIDQLVQEFKGHIDKYERDSGKSFPVRSRPSVVQGSSFKYRLNNGKIYVQTFHNENQLVEVWTPAPKGSTPHDTTAHAIIGRLISLSLKYGTPTEKLAEALEGHMDETGGIVQGVGYVSSRWDLVAHTIRRFEASLGATEEAVETPTAATLVQDSKSSGERVPGPLRSAQPVCNDCGSTQVIYADGCLTCRVCGSSKCG